MKLKLIVCQGYLDCLVYFGTTMAHNCVKSFFSLFLFTFTTANNPAIADEVVELLAGPMEVGAGCMASHSQPRKKIPVSFKEDVWVTHTESEIVDAKGKALPKQLLCHSNLTEAGKPAGNGASPTLGWDGVQPPLVFPDGSGVFLRAGTPYEWEVMLQNPYEGVFSEVFLKVKIHTKKVSSTTSKLANLRMDCASVFIGDKGALYFVPQGKSRKEKEIHFTTTGKVKFFAGHVHMHAQRIALEAINEKGESSLVWEGLPKGDSHGEFTIPYSAPGKPLYLNTKDRYKIIAEYDNTSNKDWPAMGLVCAYVEQEQPKI